MKTLCTLVAGLFFVSASALAVDPATTGAPATRANLVVGMWANESAIGPCGGPAVNHGRNTVIFNAGGTLVDNPRGPAGTALQRSIGLGTWAYHPTTDQYDQVVQFDWFLNGAYDGYQTVHRTFLISTDHDQVAGPVITVRYNADGSVRAQLCGSAISTRL